MDSLVPLLIARKHFFTGEHIWFNGILTNGKRLNVCINVFKAVAQSKKKSDQLFFFKKFGGIYLLKKTPDLAIIYDHTESFEALQEISRMSIPMISFVNSESNPNQCDYPVPGNFVSKSAEKFYCKMIRGGLKNK